MVTLVPDEVEVNLCDCKFHATPSMVRDVPVKPGAHAQPPLVVLSVGGAAATKRGRETALFAPTAAVDTARP